MIDLHMHTTASDGRDTPDALIAQLKRVGIDTFAVTDHDTTAAVPVLAELAAREGFRFIAGIEITAVYRAKDVHMLGYFVDWQSEELTQFLVSSRDDRLRRAKVMAERLEALGVPIDMDKILAANGPTSGKSIARPVIARGLLEAGHVQSIQEAFDKYLAEGKPAYEARVGASPADVVALVRRAGGIASFAHPGSLGRDELLPELVDAGLTAIEAYHSDHDAAKVEHYLGLARKYDLAVSGGSDYHGEGTRRAELFGQVALPEADFREFCRRAAAAGAGAVAAQFA